MNKFMVLFASVVILSACSYNPDTDGDSVASGTTSTGMMDQQDGDNNAGGGAGVAVADTDVTASSDIGTVSAGSEEDFIVNVGNVVNFSYDSAEISAEAQEILRRQAVWLNQYIDRSITVSGHCDERGTREYNLALGARRANAIKEYLTSLGVGGSRILTVSYGKERPIAEGSNEDAWAKNRRGETSVY